MAVPVHQTNNRHSDNWWLEDIAASLAAGGIGSSGGQYNATPPTVADGGSTPVQTDNKGNTQVVGNVASGVADTGNPVKVGGVYRSSPSALVDGQRSDVLLGARGSLSVQIMAQDGTNGATVQAYSDAASNSVAGLATVSRGSVFNGTSWDRQRGSVAGGTHVNVAATATTSKPAVTITSAIVLAANVNRKAVIIQNTSASAVIYLSLSGGTAVAGNGGDLALAAGEKFIWDKWVSVGAITAVGSAAGTLSITEVA